MTKIFAEHLQKTSTQVIDWSQRFGKGSMARVHAREWMVKPHLGKTQAKNLRKSTLNPTTHTHKVEGSDQPGLALRLGVEGAKPPQGSLKK